MLAARHPFRATHNEDLLELITSATYAWPARIKLTDEVRDLTRRFLQPDPEARLGYNGAGEVKAHPFFASVDFERLFDEPSPYFVPQLESETDSGYFPALPTEIAVQKGHTAMDGGLDPGKKYLFLFLFRFIFSYFSFSF